MSTVFDWYKDDDDVKDIIAQKVAAYYEKKKNPAGVGSELDSDNVEPTNDELRMYVSYFSTGLSFSHFFAVQSQRFSAGSSWYRENGAPGLECPFI